MNIFNQYKIKIKNLVINLNNRGRINLTENIDDFTIDIPPKNFNGDISCNVALILAKSNNLLY